ncbi:MAG: agmatine deiminase family protein [Verrucomicrobiota bacterium]|jgi:agmatine/peptidylarginine deiminase|nr:agmatine deiminase family protein [Verrucomicrobiota bacterium]
MPKHKPQNRLPAEWEPQSGVQLTWPHEDTDWAPLLGEVVPCFAAIARAVAERERCLIVCRDAVQTARQLGDTARLPNVRFVELPSDDTWTRDHGAISVFENGAPQILDFTFNGWGMKFPASRDNLITRRLFAQGAFSPAVSYRDKLHLVLEGGSLESDGQGTLLTTESCLLSPNRNDHFSKEELEAFYKELFGLDRILWLKHGYLAGDDTDSHIDTLARLCDAQTIAYVRCDDPADEHADALRQMENELRAFRTARGAPYTLIPLPMADPAHGDGHRLPATYANFLILNGAVLAPTYASPKKDAAALTQLQRAFPDRAILGIDCSPLIKQHGSLHCVTMQYPEGFID